MDTSVKKIVLSVIITVVIVLISIPLWSNSIENSQFVFADSFKENNISINVDKFESLILIEDDRALKNINPTSISLRNPNGYSKKFDLILVIDKKSTISYEYLRISLNDNIYYLKDVDKLEDDDNYYFILENKVLDKYSSEKIDTRIWLSTNASYKASSTLTTNFVIR